MPLHRPEQFRGWRGDGGDHRLDVIDLGGKGDSVAPIVRHVVDDVASAHATDGVSALGFELQPGVHISNIVGDDHLGPTGARVEMQLIDIMRFDDAGLVCEHWGVTDMLLLMQQLGVVPGGPPA